MGQKTNEGDSVKIDVTTLVRAQTIPPLPSVHVLPPNHG